MITPENQRSDTQIALAARYEKELHNGRDKLKQLDIEFKQRIADIEAWVKKLSETKPPEVAIRAAWDRKTPSPTYILKRGDHLVPGRRDGCTVCAHRRAHSVHSRSDGRNRQDRLASRVRALADKTGSSADRPCDGKPYLETPLRARHRVDQGRIRRIRAQPTPGTSWPAGAKPEMWQHFSSALGLLQVVAIRGERTLVLPEKAWTPGQKVDGAEPVLGRCNVH